MKPRRPGAAPGEARASGPAGPPTPQPCTRWTVMLFIRRGPAAQTLRLWGEVSSEGGQGPSTLSAEWIRADVTGFLGERGSQRTCSSR